MSLPSTYTISEAREKLKTGKITSVKLVKTALARIEEERQKNSVAFMKVYTQEALQTAKIADLRIAQGEDKPLLGIPISVKDSMDIQGEVTTAGSKVFATNLAATKDAAVITAVKDAGAIIIGKTNMSEFAFSGLGLNPHFGTPAHPTRKAFIAGGSTSGGAVSVADYSAFTSLGSDTGGSLRIPAAFCDIVGFKPSATRVDSDGIVPLSYSYDSIGAITRSMDDAILMDQVLAGESYVLPPAPLSQLRFFITDNYVMDDTDSEVHDQFNDVLKQLKSLGAQVVKQDFKELYQIPEINAKGGLTAAEIWCEHETFFDYNRNHYDPLVAQRIERGRSISAADYLNIRKARKKIISIAEEKLAYFDAWLMPTVAVKPPTLKALQEESEFFRFNGAVLRNTTVCNFLDGCAVSLPLGQGIGLSIAGVNGTDHKILAIAKSIEQVLKRNL